MRDTFRLSAIDSKVRVPFDRRFQNLLKKNRKYRRTDPPFQLNRAREERWALREKLELAQWLQDQGIANGEKTNIEKLTRENKERSDQQGTQIRQRNAVEKAIFGLHSLR